MKYLAITAILCFVLAGASFAGNVTVTEVIAGGGLTLTMPGNFSLPNITLGGSNYQYNTYGLVSYVEDSRGTGAGWNLGLQCSQFVTSGTPQRSLDVSKFAVYIPQDEIACVYGQSVDVTNGPKKLTTGYTDIQTTEVEVLHSLSGYGMGKYSVDIYHKLTIDAYAYAGTYTATLTGTLNAVP